MRRIAEYLCVFGEEFELEVYPGTLLGIRPGQTGIMLVVDVDDEGTPSNRTFVFKKTGDLVPANCQYIDTIRHVDPEPPHMPLLFHLFEVV